MFQALHMKMRGGLMGRDRCCPSAPGLRCALTETGPRVRAPCGFWFTIIKTDYFGLKRGTFFRVYGPEMAQVPRFGLFFENLSAETVAIVPFFQKISKKDNARSAAGSTLTQGGRQDRPTH